MIAEKSLFEVKETENVITVAPIDIKEVRAATEETALMLTTAEDLVIKTQDDYEGAANVLKIVKGKYKTLEATRKSITSPLNQAKQAVMDIFRKPLAFLSAAETKLKKSMVDYTEEQERIRWKQEEKLRKQAEAEEARKRKALEEQARKQEEKAAELRRQAEAADAKEKQRLEDLARKAEEKAEEKREEKEEVSVKVPVLAPSVKTPEGVSYRERWYAAVTDKAKLPLEYLEPNMTKLHKLAQDTKDNSPLAGVEFRCEKIVVGASS